MPYLPYRIAYTLQDAAAVTGYSKTRIYAALRDKELQARKDGNATLIESAELERWANSQEAA